MAGGLLIAAALAVAAPARGGGAPLRSSPIQVDDEGFVFVVNPDSNSVTRLSPLSGGTLGTLWEGLAGEYPRTLTLAGDSVYTANQNDDSVSRLARADGSRRQPHGSRCQIKITPPRRRRTRVVPTSQRETDPPVSFVEFGFRMVLHFVAAPVNGQANR